jgi:hypothetical protein
LKHSKLHAKSNDRRNVVKTERSFNRKGKKVMMYIKLEGKYETKDEKNIE